MLVAVSPAALTSWASDARVTASRLRGSAAEVDGALGTLRATWSGEAAAAFAGHEARWAEASAGLRQTLDELIVLVETARDNYAAAADANERIWSRGQHRGPVLQPVAWRDEGIYVDLASVEQAVVRVVGVADALGGAWAELGTALAATAGMAGDDDVGAGFGRDLDAFAGAAWQAWRLSVIQVGAIAIGISATGGNVAEAERRSIARQRGEPVGDRALITEWGPAPAPVVEPPEPPGAVGSGDGQEPATVLGWYWPRADPGRLRAAARAWRRAGAALLDARSDADAAVEDLVRVNRDPVLVQMLFATRDLLSDDPTSGLIGLLAVSGQRIASACEGFAALVEHTRGAVRDAIAQLTTGDDEWYTPVAAVLDLVLTRGWARFVAAGGDLVLLRGRLEEIWSVHADRAVGERTELSPVAADQLARFATSIVAPEPVGAPSCQVVAPAGVIGEARTEAERDALIARIPRTRHVVVPAEVAHIAQLPDGRVVWTGRGAPTAGLGHIERARRLADFAGGEIPADDVPEIALRTMLTGTPVARIGRDGTAYEVELDGRTTTVAVVVGDNGMVITTYPVDPSRAERERLTEENGGP